VSFISFEEEGGGVCALEEWEGGEGGSRGKGDRTIL